MGPETLGRLVATQGPALVLYARQWCAAPEDVVQEAFLKLVTQRVPPHDPVAWLYRVVRNRAISESRALRRRRHHEATAAARVPAWFEPSEAGGLDARAAATALRSLPVEQREIIVAHLWGGLTFEQAAALAGCSASTAHRSYTAGLTALREKLRISCPHTTPMPR